MNRTLSQVGEFGLIDRIHEIIRDEGVELPKNTLGMGDDCAAFQPRPGYDLLVTCDCMVENRHYLPQFISAHDMGRRAITLNISDVGAMGGLPLLRPYFPGTSVRYTAKRHHRYLSWISDGIKSFSGLCHRW